MPDSTDVKIAKGVVTHLGGGTYSQTFTAVRAYVPQYELEDLDTLRVVVVAASDTFTRGSRGASNNHDVEVHVAVMKRPPATVLPGADETAWTDALRYLVEEVGDRCLTIALTDPPVRCARVVNDPIWAPEHLRERRQFTSLLRLTFHLLR